MNSVKKFTVDLRPQIVSAIGKMTAEDDREWTEIHTLNNVPPSIVNWRHLHRWTESQRQLVIVELKNWCMSQDDVRIVLASIAHMDVRVGIGVACGIARSVIHLGPPADPGPLSALQLAESWVRAEVAMASVFDANEESLRQANSRNTSTAHKAVQECACTVLRSVLEEKSDLESHMADVAANAAYAVAAYQSPDKVDNSDLSGPLAALCEIASASVQSAVDNAMIGYDRREQVFTSCKLVK